MGAELRGRGVGGLNQGRKHHHKPDPPGDETPRWLLLCGGSELDSEGKEDSRTRVGIHKDLGVL